MYVTDDGGWTWSEKQKLFADDGAADDWFGVRGAVYSNIIVLAANQEASLRGRG